MSILTQKTSGDYNIRVQRLDGLVQAFSNDTILASSERAKVMYETRLSPCIYFPIEDVLVDMSETSDLNTFCPFKGTASYRGIRSDHKLIENALWFYKRALPEAKAVEKHISFMPGIASHYDLGTNTLSSESQTHISGPIIDWILREAWLFKTPQELTKAIANKLIIEGVAISRLSVLIWSLHPMIAGKHYIWSKSTDEVQERTPTYDIHTDPAFVNSPLRHVSKGLGGVRQRLTEQTFEFSFPIMDDLRAEGATDYVAMPLPFSNGQTNVLTLTCDHPNGFSTANLGLVFEISSVVSRFYEVFNQQENSKTLLETYLGQRTGARVLGGEIKRGDGDDIDAAILFCDLRNSTSLEEKLGRAKYLELLNLFFEKTTDIINANGGEVLKFIGDAVLAIFPVGEDRKLACENARLSAAEIVEQLASHNGGELDENLDCAIGIAFGDVTYGNVGSRERLDFTVTGGAANIAARLADIGKSIGHKITMTSDIAGGSAGSIPLGKFELRNVSKAVDCYALN